MFTEERRSEIRNIFLSCGVATEISAHKTRSVFDRYNIVDENDLSDAVVRLQREPAFPTNSFLPIHLLKSIGSYLLEIELRANEHSFEHNRDT